MAIIPAATNLAVNPSLEYVSTGFTGFQASVSRVAATYTLPAMAGNYSLRTQVTSVAFEPYWEMAASWRPAVVPGKTYYFDVAARPVASAVGQRLCVQVFWYTSGNVFITGTNMPDHVLESGIQHLTGQAVAPATAAFMSLRVLFRIAGAAPLFVVGEYVDFDAIDVRETPIDAYFDGDTLDCQWNGTAGQSSSFRPVDAGVLKPNSDAEGVHVAYHIYKADRHGVRSENITEWIAGGDMTYDSREPIPQTFNFRLRKSNLIHAYKDAIAVFQQIDYADDRVGINDQVGLFMVDIPASDHTKEHSLMDFQGLDVTSLLATTGVRKTYSIMSAATNWCVTPSFEHGTAGWTGSNCTIGRTNATTAWSGDYAGTVTINSIGVESYSHLAASSRVPCVKGDVMVIKAQLKPANSSEGATVAFRIRFYNSGGTVISTTTEDDVRLRSDWDNEFYKRIIAPTNAASMEIGWIHRNTGDDDTFKVGDVYYLDAIDIRKNENFDYYIDGDMDGVVWNGQRDLSTSTASNKLFTSEIRRVALEAGFISRKIKIIPSGRTMGTSRSWPPGTTRLQIINDLLTAIGYYPVQPTADGSLYSEPIRKLMDTQPYAMVFDHDILRSITETPQADSICNVAIVTRESPTRGPLSRTAVNNNILSPASTRSLDREIIKTDTISDVDDGEAAEALAQKMIDEGASYQTTLELVVAPDPTIRPNQTLDLRFRTYDGKSLSGRYWIRRWSYGLTPGDAPLKLTVGRLVEFEEDT